MTIQEFKKQAANRGVKIYSVKKYKNKHGEGYKIEHARQYNATAVSTQITSNFHGLTLQQILDQNF